jgi:hypothetical protein
MTIAEQACLADALKAIQASRVALVCNDMSLAIFELCAAHRWHAIATALHQREHMGVAPSAAEVDEKLRELQREIAGACRAPRALPSAIVASLVDSLSVLRERGVEVSDALILDRARNATCALDADFDIRQRPNPKGTEHT